MKEEGEDEDALAGGQWYGAIPFQSTARTVHVVWTNTAVHPSTAELPWSSPWFNINRLFREYAMKRTRVHELDRVHLVLVFCKKITYNS